MLINKKSPNFSLKDQNGKTHSLNDYLGKYILIFFYPRDNTPGCTMEACGFRDDFDFFYSKKHYSFRSQ